MAGLMKKMSVRPVRPKPSLSKPAKRASTTCSRAWTAGRLGRQRDRGEMVPQPQERVREDLRVRDAGRAPQARHGLRRAV